MAASVRSSKVAALPPMPKLLGRPTQSVSRDPPCRVHLAPMPVELDAMVAACKDLFPEDYWDASGDGGQGCWDLDSIQHGFHQMQRKSRAPSSAAGQRAGHVIPSSPIEADPYTVWEGGASCQNGDPPPSPPSAVVDGYESDVTTTSPIFSYDDEGKGGEWPLKFPQNYGQTHLEPGSEGGGSAVTPPCVEQSTPTAFAGLSESWCSKSPPDSPVAERHDPSVSSASVVVKCESTLDQRRRSALRSKARDHLVKGDANTVEEMHGFGESVLNEVSNANLVRPFAEPRLDVGVADPPYSTAVPDGTPSSVRRSALRTAGDKPKFEDHLLQGTVTECSHDGRVLALPVPVGLPSPGCHYSHDEDPLDSTTEVMTEHSPAASSAVDTSTSRILIQSSASETVSFQADVTSHGSDLPVAGLAAQSAADSPLMEKRNKTEPHSEEPVVRFDVAHGQELDFAAKLKMVEEPKSGNMLFDGVLKTLQECGRVASSLLNDNNEAEDHMEPGFNLEDAVDELEPWVERGFTEHLPLDDIASNILTDEPSDFVFDVTRPVSFGTPAPGKRLHGKRRAAVDRGTLSSPSTSDSAYNHFPVEGTPTHAVGCDGVRLLGEVASVRNLDRIAVDNSAKHVEQDSAEFLSLDTIASSVQAQNKFGLARKLDRNAVLAPKVEQGSTGLLSLDTIASRILNAGPADNGGPCSLGMSAFGKLPDDKLTCKLEEGGTVSSRSTSDIAYNKLLVKGALPRKELEAPVLECGGVQSQGEVEHVRNPDNIAAHDVSPRVEQGHAELLSHDTGPAALGMLACGKVQGGQRRRKFEFLRCSALSSGSTGEHMSLPLSGTLVKRELVEDALEFDGVASSVATCCPPLKTQGCAGQHDDAPDDAPDSSQLVAGGSVGTSIVDLLRQANHELSLQGLQVPAEASSVDTCVLGLPDATSCSSTVGTDKVSLAVLNPDGSVASLERRHEERFAESSTPERPRLAVGPSSLAEDSLVPLVVSATENVVTPPSSGRVTVSSPSKTASHARDKTRARSRDRVPSQSSSHDNKVDLAWAHEVAQVQPDIPGYALQSHVGTETPVPSCTDVQRSIPWPDTSLVSKRAPTTEGASDGQEHVNGRSCCGCFQRDGRDCGNAMCHHSGSTGRGDRVTLESVSGLDNSSNDTSGVITSSTVLMSGCYTELTCCILDALSEQIQNIEPASGAKLPLDVASSTLQLPSQASIDTRVARQPEQRTVVDTRDTSPRPGNTSPPAKVSVGPVVLSEVRGNGALDLPDSTSGERALRHRNKNSLSEDGSCHGTACNSEWENSSRKRRRVSCVLFSRAAVEQRSSMSSGKTSNDPPVRGRSTSELVDGACRKSRSRTRSKRCSRSRRRSRTKSRSRSRNARCRSSGRSRERNVGTPVTPTEPQDGESVGRQGNHASTVGSSLDNDVKSTAAPSPVDGPPNAGALQPKSSCIAAKDTAEASRGNSSPDGMECDMDDGDTDSVFSGSVPDAGDDGGDVTTILLEAERVYRIMSDSVLTVGSPEIQWATR